MHNFVRIWSISRKLRPPHIYQTCSMRIKSGRTGSRCGVFVGVSGSGCGNAQTICFIFQSYLHDHVSRCHILKTCNLSSVCYSPSYTLQTLHNTPSCMCFKYKSKSWSCEVSRACSKKIESGKAKKRVWCMCGCVEKRKRACPEVGVASEISFFPFSPPIYTCNHILRPHILKLWNCTLRKCGYCNTQTEEVKVLGIHVFILQYSGVHGPQIVSRSSEPGQIKYGTSTCNVGKWECRR